MAIQLVKLLLKVIWLDFEGKNSVTWMLYNFARRNILYSDLLLNTNDGWRLTALKYCPHLVNYQGSNTLLLACLPYEGGSLGEGKHRRGSQLDWNTYLEMVSCPRGIQTSPDLANISSDD